MTPEEQARHKIDALLEDCVWLPQDKGAVNLRAARRVTMRQPSTYQHPGGT